MIGTATFEWIPFGYHHIVESNYAWDKDSNLIANACKPCVSFCRRHKKGMKKSLPVTDIEHCRYGYGGRTSKYKGT